MQLRATCAAGSAFEQALNAFIEDGTGEDTAALLLPAKQSLEQARTALAEASGPGVEQVSAAVTKYLVAIESLTVLYTKGETAYQVPKNAGRDADVLRADAEDLWDVGVASIVPTDPPSAPDDFLRDCGV